MSTNVPMNDYSRGLRHGRVDQAREVRDILALDVSDEEKFRLLAEMADAAIRALGDES